MVVDIIRFLEEWSSESRGDARQLRQVGGLQTRDREVIQRVMLSAVFDDDIQLAVSQAARRWLLRFME